MALESYKIRVIANACITRYDRDEETLNDIVNSYNTSEEDKKLILERIYFLRPELKSNQ